MRQFTKFILLQKLIKLVQNTTIWTRHPLPGVIRLGYTIVIMYVRALIPVTVVDIDSNVCPGDGISIYLSRITANYNF